VYVELSEAELGKQLLLPRLCNPDSLSQYKTIPRPTLEHSSHYYSSFSLQSSSMFSLSSHTLTPRSSSSGHTPPTYSPLFGPLLFGLGPAALPFHITYLECLCVANAMEHVPLVFVHWQDAPSNESSSSFGGSGSTASVGIPTCLKDWTRVRLQSETTLYWENPVLQDKSDSGV
jgi:hypothetical protein